MQDEKWIYKNYQKILANSSVYADEAWFDKSSNHQKSHNFQNYSLYHLINFKTHVIRGMNFDSNDYEYLKYSENRRITNINTVKQTDNAYQDMKNKYSGYLHNLRLALKDDDWFGGATLHLAPENLGVSLFSIRTAFRIFDFQTNLDYLKLQPNLHSILEIGGDYAKSIYDWMSIYNIHTAYNVNYPVNITAAAL